MRYEQGNLTEEDALQICLHFASAAETRFGLTGVKDLGPKVVKAGITAFFETGVSPERPFVGDKSIVTKIYRAMEEVA